MSTERLALQRELLFKIPVTLVRDKNNMLFHVPFRQQPRVRSWTGKLQFQLTEHHPNNILIWSVRNQGCVRHESGFEEAAQVSKG
jgi:hypothetical protein